MDLLIAFGGGVLAGIGVAAPIGAIGVLLLREGLTRGMRAGAAAATAVASVDIVYCAGAVFIGAAAAPVIGHWGSAPAIVGGVVLIAVALIGIRRAARPLLTVHDTVTTGSSVARFAVFLGLTAINPATLIYFAAIAVGLGALLRTPLAAALFIMGVGIASLAWQFALVAVGALVRGRATPRGQRIATLAGNAVVAALGAAMLVAAAARIG